MKLLIIAAAVVAFVVIAKSKKSKNQGPVVSLTPSVDFETDMGKISNFQRLAYKKAA